MIKKLFEDMSDKAAAAGFQLSAEMVDDYCGFFVLERDGDRIPFYMRHSSSTPTVTIREGAALPMDLEELLEVPAIEVSNYTALIILGILLRAQIYQFAQ
jgi:hypothetical protein